MSARGRATGIAFFVAALLFGAAPASAENSWVRKEAKEFDSYYLLDLPVKRDPEKLYPLLITLHGAADIAENFVSLWSGLAPKKGYVLAVPCGDWKAPDWNEKQRSWGENSPDFLKWMVADIGKTVKIDPDRIFLNGFSAGGHMTLYAGILNPDFFCAVAPCSGCVMDCITDEELEKARFLPVRFLVGLKDMNYAGVLKSFDRLKAAGFTNVLLRKFPNLAHQYPMDENPRILDWFDKMHAERMKAKLFAQRIGEAEKALDDKRFGDAARAAKTAIDAGIAGEPRERARAILEKALAAIKLEAAERAASSLLARAGELCGAKKWTEALETLDGIASRFAGTASAEKASAIAAALRADKAVMAAVEEAETLKDCASWFSIAENHLRNGETAKAAELYRKIVRLKPDSELGKKAQSRLDAMK